MTTEPKIRTYQFTQDGVEYGPYFRSQIMHLIKSGFIKSNTEIGCDSGETTHAYFFLSHDEVPRELRDQHVVITDVQMKFWAMVDFMVKWAIASIPATIILAVILWGSLFIIAQLITIPFG